MDKDLAVKQSQQIVNSVPLPQGLEDMLPEDIMIPRAKLLQALSPEVVEGRPGARAGIFINSLTGDVLPSEFVPIFSGNQWIKFNPQDPKDAGFDPAFKPNEIVHRTTDPNDPVVLAEGHFGENGEKPTITKFINLLCLFPGQPVPLVISFAKTSHKTGKQLLNMIRLLQPTWSRKYKLSTVLDKNDVGQQYYVIKVAPGETADAGMQEQAKNIYATLRGKSLNIHDETTTTE